MSVLSIDLASRRYADNGVVVLETAGRRIRCTFHRIGTSPKEHPSASELVKILVELANRSGARCILIDGPQAWKSPENGHVHQRDCEKKLHTPGKTGEPGVVKPQTWTSFVELSVALFDGLQDEGWPRLREAPRHGRACPGVALESFPTAAWRALGLRPLPAKSKCSESEIASHLRALGELYPLDLPRAPSHDELQAIVGGLAGLALEGARADLVRVVGLPPELQDGTWREGFIVIPTLPPQERR